jgi:hypothetical protein
MKLTKIMISTIAFLALSIFAATSYGDDAECEDATSSAEYAASELSNYANRLQSCAESADYSDDCSMEFSHTRSAQDEYESAVSDVSSYCE